MPAGDKVGIATYNKGNTKITFSLSWIVLHTMHLCAVFLKEKVVICNMFDSVRRTSIEIVRYLINTAH